MKKSIIEIEVLTANEGYVLTNGETYTDTVWLGNVDSEENWSEIPIEDIPEEENEII